MRAVLDFFASNFFMFIWIWSFIAVITFCYLFFVTAPYGRHVSSNWGPSMSARTGWIFMEAPSVFFIAYLFFIFKEQTSTTTIIFLCIWLLHYTHRTLIWPFQADMQGKTMPVLVAGLAFIFNFFNVLFQAAWLLLLQEYDAAWLLSAPFIFGIIIFVIGFYINIKSDYLLINLRKTSGSGYHIPRGFLYEKISSPNYFGEILEWLGWTVMTWSPSGAVFLAWTIANLFPRSVANHKWYLQTFDEYPPDRKAILPYIY